MKDSKSYEMKNAVADKTYSLGVFTYKLKCILIASILTLIASTKEVIARSTALVELDIPKTCSLAALPQHTPAPGLFQRLIKIKYSSELYLITKAKESNRLNRPETLDSALAVYNTVRWNLDGLVYQLSGDLVAANSPKKYKQINQWCLNNKAAVTSAAAAQTLESIESLCELYLPSFSLINEMPAEESQQGTRNINLTTNVFYLIKDSYSIIKGLSDLKTQKTMALVDILDQMRLASPQELLKQVK